MCNVQNNRKNEKQAKHEGKIQESHGMSGGHNPTTESFLVFGMEIVLGWEGKAITATTSRSPAAPKLVRVTISRAISNGKIVVASTYPF